MKIFLIRHGESVMNIGGNMVERLPDHLVPLTENGIRQAYETGIWLKDYCDKNDIDLTNARIWQSPYLRTRQTTAEMNKSLGISDVKEHIALVEQQFGLFDCITEEQKETLFKHELDEYKRQVSNGGKLFARLPMGESPFDVSIRMQQFIDRINRDKAVEGDKTLFVVIHGTALRCFLLRWFDYSPEWYQAEHNPYNMAIREIDDNVDRGFINKDVII